MNLKIKLVFIAMLFLSAINSYHNKCSSRSSNFHQNSTSISTTAFTFTQECDNAVITIQKYCKQMKLNVKYNQGFTGFTWPPPPSSTKKE